jgi:hypothetical protein
MTDTSSNTPSVVERTRAVAAGAPVVAAHFLGRSAAFVLGEEAVLLVPTKGDERRLAVHAGGILSAASDGVWVITGGDDGKVFVTGEQGDSKLVATDAKRRWIDHVAAGPDGALAWSAGKSAYVMPGKGEPRSHDVASTVGGLAFAPKGLRLAVAHYNGVTLWFPNAKAAPEFLEWKGSHHHVAFSPNGQFLVTAMQEPTLHGWRVVDAKHMRMSGYSARVRSFAWTAGGKWLATSGSEQLVIQGRPDGQAAAHVRGLRGARHHGGLPSQAGGGGGRLCRRHDPVGAGRRRRRGAGEEARRRAGQRARLGRDRNLAGLGHRKRRGRRGRSRLTGRSTRRPGFRWCGMPLRSHIA